MIQSNQLINIIKPIKYDSSDSIYLVGLNLQNGDIAKIKIYNKIYKHHLKFYEFLYNFGDADCLNLYCENDIWTKYETGFSGFTVGLEIYYKDEVLQYRYGYGCKKQILNYKYFESFIIDKNKKIIDSEIYKYIPFSEYILPVNKLNTDLIEIQEKNINNYCYCPLISKDTIFNLQNKILNCLSEKNKNTISKIITDNIYLVNYGESYNYEKIYLLHKNKRSIQQVINTIIKIQENHCLTSLTS